MTSLGPGLAPKKSKQSEYGGVNLVRFEFHRSSSSSTTNRNPPLNGS
jgi:hypothetical protein